MAISFELNGALIEIEPLDIQQSLLHWLRAQGLTGSKEGCAEGECGACAVAVLSTQRDTAQRYIPINSCLLPLAEADGKAFVTVEHLASRGSLHPVQKAMVAAGGSQCGYCTPGFVMSLFCEYYRPTRVAYDPHAISGNLCRCTGYRPIRQVAEQLPAPSNSDPWLQRLATDKRATDGGQSRAVAPNWFRPATLAEALVLLQSVSDAVPLAGGTDLVARANQLHTRLPAVVSLERLPELKRLEFTDQEITLGSGLTLADIESELNARQEIPLLRQLFPLFSSRLIRNRATLGGNLGTASAIGDSPPVLLALDAELTLSSATRTRRIPLRQFFRGYRTTALEPGELIVSVHLLRPLPLFQRFYKVSKRVMDDISTVSGAFGLDLEQDGTVRRLRVAYGGIAATPIQAEELERLAQGKGWNEDTLSELAATAASFGTPMDDHRGSGRYRGAMVVKLLQRFFYESRSGRVPTERLEHDGVE